MIRPSRSSGDSHDGQPGHAVIAARLRNEMNDNTKLTAAIPTVNQTAAVRLRRTSRRVRRSSAPSPALSTADGDGPGWPR